MRTYRIQLGYRLLTFHFSSVSGRILFLLHRVNLSELFQYKFPAVIG